MNFLLLEKKAKLAREKLLASQVIDLNKPSHKSILKQVEFIIKWAEKGINPIEQLTADQSFTYSVIASREFSSPDELLIKNFLDSMSQELYYEDYQKI